MLAGHRTAAVDCSKFQTVVWHPLSSPSTICCLPTLHGLLSPNPAAATMQITQQCTETLPHTQQHAVTRSSHHVCVVLSHCHCLNVCCVTIIVPLLLLLLLLSFLSNLPQTATALHRALLLLAVLLLLLQCCITPVQPWHQLQAVSQETGHDKGRLQSRVEWWHQGTNRKMPANFRAMCHFSVPRVSQQHP